jgi:hypothetical protein
MVQPFPLDTAKAPQPLEGPSPPAGYDTALTASPLIASSLPVSQPSASPLLAGRAARRTKVESCYQGNHAVTGILLVSGTGFPPVFAANAPF